MAKEILKELNVEKLNVCEPDGSVRLCLFNSQNVPGLILGGQDLLPGHRSEDGIAGLMFYNNHGDECGGLVYSSQIDDEGKVSMGMSLTLDKWKQDQLVQLHLEKEDEVERYGLSIYDRPDCSIGKSLEMINEFHSTEDKERKIELVKELNKNNQKRLFVGHGVDGDTKVSLYDKTGREQLKLFIDESDKPQIEINGKKLPLEKLMKLL